MTSHTKMILKSASFDRTDSNNVNVLVIVNNQNVAPKKRTYQSVVRRICLTVLQKIYCRYIYVYSQLRLFTNGQKRRERSENESKSALM